MIERLTMQSYRENAGVELKVVADLAEIGVAAAFQFTNRAAASIQNTGRFAVALSGGATPCALFGPLAQDRGAGLDWQNIHVFWGDERCVPPYSVASNYLMAKEQLLDHVPIPAANVHRIHTEEPASVAASEYEAELRRFFKPTPGAWPRFDLLLLGVGEDGHTASLFPATAALREDVHMVARNFVLSLNAERITLTFPTINAAACVLVLASGAGKSAIVRSVLDTSPEIEALPMQGVRPRDGRLLWLLDAAAAADLSTLAGAIAPN